MKAKVDLTEEKKIGLEWIKEIQKLYPEFELRGCTRSHSWSSCWYLEFKLVSTRKISCSESLEITRKLREIVNDNPKWYNDFIQCGYMLDKKDPSVYPSNTWFIHVFAITKTQF